MWPLRTFFETIMNAPNISSAFQPGITPFVALLFRLSSVTAVIVFVLRKMCMSAELNGKILAASSHENIFTSWALDQLWCMYVQGGPGAILLGSFSYSPGIFDVKNRFPIYWIKSYRAFFAFCRISTIFNHFFVRGNFCKETYLCCFLHKFQRRWQFLPVVFSF